MATHAIASDSCNLTINFVKDESDLLGKIAFQEDRAKGNLIRRLVLRGLAADYPAEAARIESIRQAHAASVHKLRIEAAKIARTACLFFATASIAFMSFASNEPARMARTVSVRTVRREA